jgi:hypothetical protein
MICEDYEPDDQDYRQRRVHDADARTGLCDEATDTLPRQTCPRCGEPNRKPPAEIVSGSEGPRFEKQIETA